MRNDLTRDVTRRRNAQNDVDAVKPIKPMSHQLPVSTFTLQAKKSWTIAAMIP
jgi:hypothetical protein